MEQFVATCRHGMLTHGTENMVSFGNPQSVGGDLIMTELGVQLTLRQSIHSFPEVLMAFRTDQLALRNQKASGKASRPFELHGAA